MKIGVSSYSYSRYLTEKRLDLFGVIEKTAQLGFDGIEFSGLGLPAGSPDVIPFAGKIKEACKKAGLPIFSYTIGADFLSAPTWQVEVERLKGEVKVAAALGVPCMRHDGTRGFPENHKGSNDFAAALPILADGCRAVSEFAAGLGVKTMVENHGCFVQDSVRCEQLMRAVNHKNFGSLIDIGNFACADEESVSAVTRMASYAFHVHAKDFYIKNASQWADPGEGWFKSRGGNYLRGSIIGHGDVNVVACIKAVKAAGYTGPLSIEFEGMEDNLQALKIGLANLRRYTQV
ncbi:MAG: sugar phosphate isomerase/epimerase [Phycisphaerae bacterium]